MESAAVDGLGPGRQKVPIPRSRCPWSCPRVENRQVALSFLWSLQPNPHGRAQVCGPDTRVSTVLRVHYSCVSLFDVAGRWVALESLSWALTGRRRGDLHLLFWRCPKPSLACLGGQVGVLFVSREDTEAQRTIVSCLAMHSIRRPEGAGVCPQGHPRVLRFTARPTQLEGPPQRQLTTRKWRSPRSAEAGSPAAVPSCPFLVGNAEVPLPAPKCHGVQRIAHPGPGVLGVAWRVAAEALPLLACCLTCPGHRPWWRSELSRQVCPAAVGQGARSEDTGRRLHPALRTRGRAFPRGWTRMVSLPLLGFGSSCP